MRRRQRRSSGVRPGRAGVVGLAAIAAIAGCAQQAAPPAQAPARQDDAGLVSGLGAARWGFRAPAAIAAAGNRVWVADQAASAVYELNSGTGALIRVISGRRYRISGPDAIAANRASVWVANGNNNTVTQLSAASGGLIRVISAPGDQLNVPTGLAVAGGRVWVASDGSDLVTELSAATGGLIRVIQGVPYRFETLNGVAAAGGRVWVPGGGASVTEISATTGGLIRSLQGPRYQFGTTDPVAVGGGRVWVGSSAGNPSGRGGDSVTEISASTGALTHVTRSLPSLPMAIAAAGDTAWSGDERRRQGVGRRRAPRGGRGDQRPDRGADPDYLESALPGRRPPVGGRGRRPRLGGQRRLPRSWRLGDRDQRGHWRADPGRGRRPCSARQALNNPSLMLSAGIQATPGIALAKPSANSGNSTRPGITSYRNL